MRCLGVDIAIDDLGTGYSSVLYLKRLPANELNTDRGFVGDLVRGGDDVVIVSAIVALGQALKGWKRLSSRRFLPNWVAIPSRVSCWAILYRRSNCGEGEE